MYMEESELISIRRKWTRTSAMNSNQLFHMKASIKSGGGEEYGVCSFLLVTLKNESHVYKYR